jgi:hypothetical protein
MKIGFWDGLSPLIWGGAFSFFIKIYSLALESLQRNININATFKANYWRSSLLLNHTKSVNYTYDID